jgi:hypothetical protein
MAVQLDNAARKELRVVMKRAIDKSLLKGDTW